MNQFFSRFAKDNVIVASGHVLNFAKPLVLTPLILKSAPAEVFGAYVLVLTLGGFLAAFAPCGVDFLAKRHLPSADGPGRRRELFYPQLLLQLAALGLCALLLAALERPLLSLFFRGAPPFSIGLAAAYPLCYAAFAQFGDYFRYTGRMRAYMGASVAYPYLSILAVVALRVHYGTFTVNALLLAEIIPLLLISAWLAVRIAREIGVRVPAFDWAELGESVRLGFPLLMVSVNEFLLFSGSRYVIAAFLGVSAVACFTAASQLGNLPMFFPRAMGVALPPLLCRARDSGHEREFDAMVHYAVKGHLLVSMPFAALSLFFGRELLSLFSTRELAAAAWPLVPALAAGSAVYGTSLTLSKIFVVDKETALLLKASLLSGATSFLLTLVLVKVSASVLPAGGAIFLGYAVMLAVLTANSPAAAAALSSLRAPRIAASAAASSAAGYILYRALGPAGLFPGLFASAGAFAALAAATGIVSAKEFDFIKGVFRRRDTAGPPAQP